MSTAELDSLITREIKIAAKGLIADADKDRIKAAELIARAEQNERQAMKMLNCDKAGKHYFVEVKGTGMFGDRFEEKCKHCGWIHTS
jgi:hypothetical protein